MDTLLLRASHQREVLNCLTSMPKPAAILLAEDWEEDILLIRAAFQGCGFPNLIHVVRDGEEAIAYLAGDGKYRDRAEYPLPDLVLLDLKMPHGRLRNPAVDSPTARLKEPGGRGAHFFTSDVRRQRSLQARS